MGSLVVVVVKTVGNQAVTNHFGKYAERGQRFIKPPGGQKQTGQRDERVAAPISKPGIAGQNRALGFAAHITFDDEIIGGDRQ